MKMIEYKLRAATVNDISAIMAIETESFKEGVREEKETFIKRINSFPDGFLLLEINGHIVGYICTEIWSEKHVLTPADFKLDHDPEQSHNPKGNTLYISSIATLKKYRGQGLGKVLFENIIQTIPTKYPEVSKCVLLVSETWIPAIKMYKKYGFEEIFRLPDFFKPSDSSTEAGIVMDKVRGCLKKE